VTSHSLLDVAKEMIRIPSQLLLAVLLGLPLVAAAAPSTEGARTPAVQVRAVPAETSSGAIWVPASVVAVDRATISTRVAAAVRAVAVREGERVARGQVLGSLADADLRGAAAAAQTSLAAAAAQERRVQSLLAEGAAPQADLDTAAARRAQAQAALAAAHAERSYAQLRAPFAGTVQARRVEPGDLVGPGQPLVVLEGDALELVDSLSESEAAGLALGAEVSFTADGTSGSARVTSLTPGGDPLSHRRGLRARITRVAGSLRSGAFARLEAPGAVDSSPHAWVPRSALVERGDLTGVFVASGGKAELRWIAVGEPAGDGVHVRAGLRPGDQVIDAPGALRDGQPVEVVP
jgi:RND family efflux transporter MFP subunit